MQLLFNKILWVVFRQFDVLQLQEVGDFEAQNCLPEPPISCSTHVKAVN